MVHELSMNEGTNECGSVANRSISIASLSQLHKCTNPRSTQISPETIKPSLQLGRYFYDAVFTRRGLVTWCGGLVMGLRCPPAIAKERKLEILQGKPHQ